MPAFSRLIALTLIAIIQAIGFGPGVAAAQSSSGACVDKVDDLSLAAIDFELTVKNSKAVQDALSTCTKAINSASGSDLVRLSYAKALIWSGNYTDALVQLEMLRQSGALDADAVDIGAAMCAYGRGSARVQNSTCQWALEEGISEPDLAYMAGKRRIAGGAPEDGLQFYAQAAVAGHPDADRIVMSVCSEFDSAKSSTAPVSRREFAGVDPAVAAAIACEASYLMAEPDTEDWANAGFKFAETLTHFDDYESVAATLGELSGATDQAVFGQVVAVADSLCTNLAGDPADPDFGASGIQEVMIVPENAMPVCELAAYLWPDSGRLHYNLARVYNLLGASHEADADAALEEAVRLGYPLAKKLTAPSAVPFDLAKFNAPAILRGFYDQEFSQLNTEPYYTLVYAKTLNETMGSGDVLFLGQNAAQLMLEVNANLNYEITQKLADPAVFNDVMNKGIQNVWGPLSAIVNARQSGASIMDEMSDFMGAAASTPSVQAERLISLAQQDAKRLAILYDTNPDDVRKIIEGMTLFVRQ